MPLPRASRLAGRSCLARRNFRKQRLPADGVGGKCAICQGTFCPPSLSVNGPLEPLNSSFLPDAALVSSAASSYVRHHSACVRQSGLVSGQVLYLLIDFPALIIALSLSSQGLSNEYISDITVGSSSN